MCIHVNNFFVNRKRLVLLDAVLRIIRVMNFNSRHVFDMWLVKK